MVTERTGMASVIEVVRRCMHRQRSAKSLICALRVKGGYTIDLSVASIALENRLVISGIVVPPETAVKISTTNRNNQTKTISEIPKREKESFVPLSSEELYGVHKLTIQIEASTSHACEVSLRQ